MTLTAPTFVSLYAGAGGLDLGFKDAGFAPVWANDFDHEACSAYRANLGDHIVEGDVDDALAGAGLDDSSPMLVIGGPPCQGFSVAGRMNPNDNRSLHVWRFLEAVEAIRPQGFVMENVAALATNTRWELLIRALITRGSELGFHTRLHVLNASHYDVPQARKRMFLVGLRDAPLEAPAPVTEDRPPTVRQALSGLPRWGAPGNDQLCTAKVTPALRPVLRRSPFAGLLFNGKGRALNLDAPAPTLPATMGGNRTPVIDQDSVDDPEKRQWILWYHARLIGGGAPVKKIPTRLRRLTVREAAILQGFPPGWQFSGPQSARFRQIGNAVPPPLGYHLAVAIRQVLEDEASARASTPSFVVA